MTEEFEHPNEIPEPAEELIDLMALAGHEPDRFDPSQPVVKIQEYREFVEQAVADGKRAAKNYGAMPAEEPLKDEQLGAKFISRIEFDEEAAIERVRNKKWLIYGVLPHNDVGYIYGKPGSYKSFMALDIACRVGSASKWNGIDVDYPGMVLYIAAEGGSELHLRKKAWRIATGEDNSAVNILERSVMINDPMERTELKAAMRYVEEKCGMRHVLVVIDTFSKCFAGNENDAADMRAFIAGCEDIRDSFNGCTVLFVGHTGKVDPNSMRGSSTAVADCGFSYKITRGKEKLYAEMHTDKIKDAVEPDDMAFEFSVVRTGDTSIKGLELTSLVPKMTALLERVEVEDLKKEFGRAEKPRPAPRGTGIAKNMAMSQLRLRAMENDGQPVSRLVIRDDVINMLMASEDMKENTAKSCWTRAVDELLEAGSIEKCDGDQWLPVKGK